MTSEPKIFVSIACYMDSDIINTVQNLYENAAFPELLSIGICLQYDPDINSFPELDKFPQVKVDRIHYTEAKGPIYARYRCEQLLDNEDYFLQLDCHSRCFPNWDITLIDELTKCKKQSDKAVISHYPISTENMKDPEKLSMIGQLNRFRYIGPDSIKMHGTLVTIPTKPIASYGISAAMLFMESNTKKNIPYDPFLHFGLHAPEQFLYSARLWTHGYDIFAPTRHTIATEYLTNRERIPEHMRKHYNRESSLWEPKTWSKVKYLLGIDSRDQVDKAYSNDIDQMRKTYGMGFDRDLYDYYKFIKLHDDLLLHFPFYKEQYLKQVHQLNMI